MEAARSFVSKFKKNLKTGRIELPAEGQKAFANFYALVLLYLQR